MLYQPRAMLGGMPWTCGWTLWRTIRIRLMPIYSPTTGSPMPSPANNKVRRRPRARREWASVSAVATAAWPISLRDSRAGRDSILGGLRFQRLAVEEDFLAGELLRRRVPGKVDQDLQAHRVAGRRHARPGSLVRAGHFGDLEDALRPD